MHRIVVVLAIVAVCHIIVVLWAWTGCRSSYRYRTPYSRTSAIITHNSTVVVGHIVVDIVLQSYVVVCSVHVK